MGWLTAAFVLVLLLKLFLATQLDLYSDEVFYWWASTKLALAYSDLPFMTALLAGIGSGFGPSDAFAVRSLFLLLGTLLPLLIYWLAKPISNHQQALESAALTLCLPLAGFMGLLAVPDVPLVVFGILSIGFFQRALSEDQLVYWVATGCSVTLGLSTHYRFFLYPLAAILFLTLFTPEHRQWRNGKFWLAVAIASLGLIPILWFNLSNQLSSASFYLVERHPWEFQAAGLLHLFKQAGLVTPPLYFVFILTLVGLYRKARQRNRNAALLLAFACTNLAVYWVLAPWTDANSTSIHWPLSGYFPLLVAVPLSLRSAFKWCSVRWGEVKARRLVLAIPAIGFIGTLVAFIGIGSQAYQMQLQPFLGTGVLSDKMAGWKELAEFTTRLADNQYSDSNPLIVTDNYYTAAQLELAGLTTIAITIDRDKAIRDGRITQLRLWNKGENGLSDFVGYPALYINEDSTLTIDEKTSLMATMCSMSTAISPVSALSLYNGDKAFSFYSVEQITPASSSPAYPCPYPMQAWIDSPAADATLTGTINVSGWAYSEDNGIQQVHVLLNGERFASADYGISRIDVVDARQVSSDPNAPNLGFEYSLDTRELANGEHTLAVELINRAGTTLAYGERQIRIDN